MITITLLNIVCGGIVLGLAFFTALAMFLAVDNFVCGGMLSKVIQKKLHSILEG